MSSLQASWLVTGLLLLSALVLLFRPLLRLLRLLLRSGVGLAVLALLRQAGKAFGINLGVNPINALILGLLGIPGLALLLMLQWVLKSM